MGPAPLEGAVKEERFPHPGKTLHWLGDEPDRKGVSEAPRRVQQPACVRQNGERSVQRVVATLLHSPARDMHLLVCTAAGC